MLPTYCGAMGYVGWLVMLLVWTVLVSLAIWGITRLFPDRPRLHDPDTPRDRHGEDVPEVPVESGRR